jgi:hypothetical protein
MRPSQIVFPLLQCIGEFTEQDELGHIATLHKRGPASRRIRHALSAGGFRILLVWVEATQALCSVLRDNVMLRDTDGHLC